VKEPSSEKAYPFYYDALEDIKKGDFNSAAVKLDSAIYYNPKIANFYFVQGRVYDFLDKPHFAITAYEQSVRLKSYNPEAWIRLGELNLWRGEYENSSFYLKKVVQAYPDSVKYILKLAESHCLNKKYHLALDQLKKYQNSISNPDVELTKWLGITYFGLKSYEKASGFLEEYIKSVPDDHLALKYFGLVKFELKQFNQALTYLNKALEFYSEDPEVYLYRARYFLQYNKSQAALNELKLGLGYDKLNPDILYELGLYYYQIEDYKESKYHFLEAVDKTPGYWQAYRYLGLLYERENNLELAYEFYTLYLKNTFTEDKEIQNRLEDIESQLLKNE
jgi:tetratricopeptide (TPR) repeat protein